MQTYFIGISLEDVNWIELAILPGGFTINSLNSNSSYVPPALPISNSAFCPEYDCIFGLVWNTFFCVRLFFTFVCVDCFFPRAEA